MFVRVVLLKNVPSCVMRRFGSFTQADVLSTQLRLEGAFLFMFCLLQILISTYTHRRAVCNTVTLSNNPPPSENKGQFVKAGRREKSSRLITNCPWVSENG